MKIAVLDDYQNVALDRADWSGLNAEVTVFTDHIPDVDELARALAGFEVVVAMRERTRFSADVLARLPDLRLLVTTGPRNAAIDVAAATRQGVVVCGTGYYPEPTVELTWALILAAARNLPTEERAVRDGAGSARSAQSCAERPSASSDWETWAAGWRGSARPSAWTPSPGART